MTARDTPFFSIVIPTYNRHAQLSGCLRACARLDYPRDCFEVIVVDDGGTAPLDAVLGQFNGMLTLQLLRQANAGPGSARNRGVFAARGEFVAFTDDDCLPAPEWLRALAAHFAAAPECAVGGQTLNALTQNLYSTASQHLIAYLFSYYNGVPHAARFCPSNNLAFPTKSFLAIGGFDTAYRWAAAEDRELCDRWLHCGHRMVFASDAVVYHAHELTLRTFLRQHFRYGRGAFHFHKARARRGQLRVKVEPPTFYFNMLCYPLVEAKRIDALVVILLLVVSQLANGAGLFFERAREKLA
jgi:cellulose synthase/poly-beta-1,6-N-acetylglucosamine synthase-like glycosyltransferase